MDAYRLRVLRELADRGTVGATAQALSMTPSAVSQQLKVLSKEAGVDLLEPDGRRVRLTDAGRALVLRADEVVAALDRATAEMHAYRSSPRGRVRAALFPSGAALLLPGILTALKGSGVDLDASDEDLPASAVPALLADYDVVLTHRDERASPSSSPRVRAEPLMREPIDLILPKRHPLAGQEAVRLDQLADEAWISVRGGFPVDDVLISIAAATGIAPRVVHRLNDFRAIEGLVAGGHGVALLARHSVTNPGVVRRPLDGVRAARIYELARRPSADDRPAVGAVLNAFRSVSAEILAGDRPALS